jgi:hypothetical protein
MRRTLSPEIDNAPSFRPDEAVSKTGVAEEARPA